ncbi:MULTISPECIES: hypothetical protein [Kitasatospora]|uniref:Uncharacterized protein n=1 Tax=Kitasatospora cystarginea TaxID=58350 RepID=A0ABP5RGP0_9ACTN
MGTGFRPRTGEGMSLLGILLLLLLEIITLCIAPVEDRPLVGGTLIGAAAAAFVTTAAVLHHSRRTVREARRPLPEVTDGDWFSRQDLEGFPMEAVRPLLRAPDAPSLNRLYVAWLFATQGHDVPWLIHHLDLPAEAADVLVNAARSSPNTS